MGPDVILTRQSSTPQGTLGSFVIQNDVKTTFVSGELPYNNDLPNISCINAGKYLCQYLFSPHFNKKVYHVIDDDRVAVEIHSGNFFANISLINPLTGKNYLSDVLGCILLGTESGTLNNQLAVLNSREAITQFEAIMNGQDFNLTIQ